jgi:hypothetical protein
VERDAVDPSSSNISLAISMIDRGMDSPLSLSVHCSGRMDASYAVIDIYVICDE